MRLNALFVIAFCCFIISNAEAQSSVEIISPDGNCRGTFFLRDGKMSWSVIYKDQPVVLESKLGILGYTSQMKLVDVKESEHNSTWKPIYGERSQVTDHYRSAQIELERPGNRNRLVLEFRAYNAGVAFRYVLPEHPDGGTYVYIKGEETRFKLPEGTKGWFTPRAQAVHKLLPLAEWKEECERPLTLELSNGLFACLTEAQMVNYARTKFVVAPDDPNTIACSLYGEVGDITPFATPWRVAMVAEQAGQLLENNDLILNLNPPCEIDQTWWIRPGKVMREVTLSMDGVKSLVDFAVKRNIQYIHFDAGWYGHELDASADATTVTVDPRRNPKSDLDMKAAVAYAKSKGVGVFVYVNQRALATQLDDLLPLYRSWGIAGIKFGFVHVGSHRWTTWLHDAVKKCAKYHLLVDIHDEYRPTGFSRTYPNLMTQEGVYGNEEMPDATNNTVLPFTRFVAGAADYTICYYHRPETKPSLMQGMAPRVLKTTPAHQLALSMIYYSPLQWMYWYDKPSDSQDEPELAFFDALPTVWDDTKVLSGRPGESAVLARRSGEEWFVGAITNTESRTVVIDLSFLPAGKMFVADLYTDGDAKIPTRTKVKVAQQRVSSSQKLTFNLKASGGVALKLTPTK